jgi:sortase B
MKEWNAILIIFCALVALACCICLFGYYRDSAESDAEYRRIAFQIDGAAEYGGGENSGSGGSAGYNDKYRAWFKNLKKKNADSAAWIKIPGTKVDYPVMRAPEKKPEYYLHRNFRKERSASGALFMPHICDPDKPSGNIIVYGHNMQSGSMFGALRKYTKKSYAEKHGTIKYGTERGWETYRIAAVFTASVGTGQKSEFRYYEVSDFASESDFENYIKAAEERRLYDTGERPKFGDRLLTLSTCEYTHKNGRLVLVARKVGASALRK